MKQPIHRTPCPKTQLLLKQLRIITLGAHPVNRGNEVFYLGGAPRFLCARARHISIVAIPHIRFHMCRQLRFALTRDHETGIAMSRPMATGRCRGRDAPRLRRASRPRHRQPCGFHRSAGHECGLRRTRIRLPRRLHEWGTGKENNSSLQLLTPDPCVLTLTFRVYSCRASGPIRDRVSRQADRPIAEKRCWRRRMPPGHATVRRD